MMDKTELHDKAEGRLAGGQTDRALVYATLAISAPDKVPDDKVSELKSMMRGHNFMAIMGNNRRCINYQTNDPVNALILMQFIKFCLSNEDWINGE